MGIVTVEAAGLAFVGSHFLLSHPLRQPLISRIGEGGFMGLYSVVAFATLGWLSNAYRATPEGEWFWTVGDGLWLVVTLLMLGASILLVGSVVGNPALPTGGAPKVPPEARGVYAVTRHPMMWAVAIWALCHIVVYPVAKTMVLSLSMAILALVGAALQDRKKERLQPEAWRSWEARTSFMPFAAVLSGRARLAGFTASVLLGGTLFWLVATWAHLPLAGWSAGVWRWL